MRNQAEDFADALEAHAHLLLRLKAELMVAWGELALARLRFRRKTYDPQQPRVPAGQSDGGQWLGSVSLSNPTGRTISRRPRVVAQSGYSFGELVGQSRVRGGGFVCFYKFEFGTIMVDGAVNRGCPLRVPSAAVRHGTLVGNDN